MDISERIITWYKENKRDLPWRNTQNAYLIWLSEIILQQTRVEQGLPYFEKFLSNYPTVNHLAKAPEQDILKLWQGLGYYSRARNLHFTAKIISQDWNGCFPKKFQELKKLKGIGDYTSAAIASFANNEKVAVVDGNVFRVLSRYFALPTAIDSGAGKKEFNALANEIIGNNPAEHNQAMMELGALICKPKQALCETCPLNSGCLALANNQVYEYPVKLKKIKQKTRYFNYIVLEHGQQVYLKQRGPKDIWQGLYDFPLEESSAEIQKPEDLCFPEALIANAKSLKPKFLFKNKASKHLLTHQIIEASFWHFKLDQAPNDELLVALSPSLPHNYPLPKLIENYIKKLFI